MKSYCYLGQSKRSDNHGEITHMDSFVRRGVTSAGLALADRY